jgi:hypothetical protein
MDVMQQKIQGVTGEAWSDAALRKVLHSKRYADLVHCLHACVCVRACHERALACLSTMVLF